MTRPSTSQRMARGIAQRTGLRTVLTHHSNHSITLRLYGPEGDLMGNFAGMALDRDDMREVQAHCPEAIAAHVRTGKPLWVLSTQLHATLRGTGIGRMAYMTLFAAIDETGGLVVPDYCAGGSTSVSARRVWRRAKEHPASGLRTKTRRNPVSVRKVGGKYRIVEPDGSIALASKGAPRDGGGHSSRAKAERQMRAINGGQQWSTP